MDCKYAMKMESLKRSLTFFYNLADQVISLYNMIRIKMDKYSDKEEYNDIIMLLNRSLVIIAKIIDKMPICLDSSYCDKFIRNFDFHINLLCTLYHSLNHFDLISNLISIKIKKVSLKKKKSFRESTKCIQFTLKLSKFTSITLIYHKLCF